MLEIVEYSGPFAVPLAVLSLVVGYLLVRAVIGGATAERPDGGGALLFWGFVAAVLGFLGQCAALYRILGTVVTAEALAPDVVARGFVLSFVTTLWGGGLLLLAGVGWVALRWAGGRRTAAAALVLVLLGMGSSGGSAQAVDITDGVWAGDGGPDTFLFELRGTPPDGLSGMVHVMRDGRMDSELAITRASYRPPELELYIGATNATYRGHVDDSRKRVIGELSFGDRAGPTMELRWLDPATVPGYASRAEAGLYVYAVPSPGGGWTTASPEEVGLDRGALEALVSAVARGEAGLIHSLAVVRDGKLVLDEYFHGYGPGDIHRLASTTKSISSLLVGAAIDRGQIAGVDAGLLALLGAGDPSDPAWDGITLRHLLTMTMGLDWSEEEMESVHGTGPAFFERVLGRRVVAEPGTEWAYASANVNLLAGVLLSVTGQHAEAFARDVLFGPLGITAYDWSYGREGGYNLMDGSLRLRPRDLAKIGAMVAAGGRWAGRQVLSAGWIEESTGARVSTGGAPPFGEYGYLWWVGALPTGGGPQPLLFANGRGSQFVLVFPGLDLVVVTTGGNDDNGRHLDIGRVLVGTLLATL